MSGTSVVHLTETSSGAPTCNGVDGSLTAIMDWALVQNGWAIEYSTGNARVYRPAVGNRFRLHLNHSTASSGNAQLCIVRGCENASNATTLIDPFPTAALCADTVCNWLTSTSADATARNYDLYVGDSWVVMFINCSGLTNIWDFNIFGDVPPSLSGDSYNTFVQVRNSAATSQLTNVQWALASGGAGLAGRYWCRNYDGTVKSSFGNKFNHLILTTQARLGPSGGIDNTKTAMIDGGSQSTTASTTLSQPVRGWFPNIRVPLHLGRGSVNTRDTFTDTAYDASSLFRVFTAGNAAGSAFVAMEESTGTWNPPSG